MQSAILQKKSVMHTVQRMKHPCSISINGLKQSYDDENGVLHPYHNNELRHFHNPHCTFGMTLFNIAIFFLYASFIKKRLTVV